MEQIKADKQTSITFIAASLFNFGFHVSRLFKPVSFADPTRFRRCKIQAFGRAVIRKGKN